MISLTLDFGPSEYVPATSLVYEAESNDAKISSSCAVLGDEKRQTVSDADIVELALRYSQKKVASAKLALDTLVYSDTNGDGLAESLQGESLAQPIVIWRHLATHLHLSEDFMMKYVRTATVYDDARSLSCEDARSRVITASCGSMIAEIHSVSSQSAVWAAVPPAGRPNEVHRHLGGNVYCLFFRGEGRLHRVDPVHGFETVLIRITDRNSFQYVGIPTHLWYQPINTGTEELQYVMIHEPAFEHSEQLVLTKSECPSTWGFEF